jgi:ABC-2 type transport system permease protein
MCFRLYKTRLKCLFRNKESMFWSYMFPIILASCFYFGFSNIWSAESFDTIPIAYDNEGAENDFLKELISSFEITNGKPMFDITYCDKVEAKKLLDDKKIEAYIIGSEDPVLYLNENGMNETIVKAFLDNYRRKSVTIETVLKENPNAIEEGLLDDVMQFDQYAEEVKSEKNPDNMLIYFYALMAYTCIFAANWGLDEVINIQADLSSRGARVSMSPMNKMKLFFCNLSASFTAHLGSLALLFVYMYFIMKVDFGDNLLYLILICLLGSLNGLTLGAAIGVWVKKKAEVKEAILLVIVLGGGFLSGMMVAQIKYMIADKFPLLGYINPVNLVTDAMYSLYYYDTYERFFLNTGILFIITILLGAASYMGIRRKNYASI